MSTFADPVRRYMHAEPATLRSDLSARDAEQELRRRGVDELPVIDANGVLVGRVTREGLQSVAAQRGAVVELAQVAEPALLRVSPDLPLSAVALRMRSETVPVAYVVCAGRLMGCLQARNLLEATRDHRIPTPIGALAKPLAAAQPPAERALWLAADTPAHEAADRWLKAGASTIVAVDAQRAPVGVVSAADFVALVAESTEAQGGSGSAPPRWSGNVAHS